jgi:hypothetical protein
MDATLAARTKTSVVAPARYVNPADRCQMEATHYTTGWTGRSTGPDQFPDVILERRNLLQVRPTSKESRLFTRTDPPQT